MTNASFLPILKICVVSLIYLSRVFEGCFPGLIENLAAHKNSFYGRKTSTLFIWKTYHFTIDAEGDVLLILKCFIKNIYRIKTPSYFSAHSFFRQETKAINMMHED